MRKRNRLSLGTNIKILLCTGMLALAACKRAEEAPTSFSIMIPTAQQLSGASQSMQSVLDFELLCFAIDVQGGVIKNKEAQTCQPAKGVIFGSAKPGGVISGELLAGTYSFKVYALKRDSVSESCPKVTADSWNWPLSKVYSASAPINQTVSEGKSDIKIQINVPDAANNIIAEYSYPATCLSANPTINNPTGYKGRFVAGAKILSGTTYKMYSNFSLKPEIKNLDGATYKMRNWKVGN